jgi:transposase
MTQKSETKVHYTFDMAREELKKIESDLSKAIAGAEKRRADVAMKLQKSGHSARNIAQLFSEMGVKVSETTVGRDIVTAQVLAIESDLDYSTVTEAIRNGKETGVTISQLKKIVNAPKSTKAEKRQALATVIPSASTSKPKNSPRDKFTIAKEQIDKMVEWVGQGKLESEDLATLLGEALTEIGYELDSE